MVILYALVLVKTGKGNMSFKLQKKWQIARVAKADKMEDEDIR